MSPFLLTPQLLSCESDFDGICQDTRFTLRSELRKNIEIDFMPLVVGELVHVYIVFLCAFLALAQSEEVGFSAVWLHMHKHRHGT